jgi:hypothetical protein
MWVLNPSLLLILSHPGLQKHKKILPNPARRGIIVHVLGSTPAGRSLAMVVTDYADLVGQYKRYNRIVQKMHSTLLKHLPQKAIDVCGRNLGIMVRGTLVFRDEDESCVLMDHCLYDYYENGLNTVQRFLKQSPPEPGSDESIVLRAMADSFFTLVQIEEIAEPLGVWVYDLFTDRKYLLADLSMAATAWEDVILATRIIPYDDFVTTSGAARPVDEESYDLIYEYLDRFVGDEGFYYIEGNQVPKVNGAILRICLEQPEDSIPFRHLNPDREDQNPYLDDQNPYVEEVCDPIHADPRIGRNDPCPCGSGKKYKKCCARNE